MPRKSKVAAESREAMLESMRKMTPGERVKLALELGEQGVQVYMATQNVDADTARKAIRRSRQVGRHYSRCMDDRAK